MKQITNPRLSQISIYENIEFLNITEPNINLITGLNSIFYLTIDSISTPITFNCSLNKLKTLVGIEKLTQLQNIWCNNNC